MQFNDNAIFARVRASCSLLDYVRSVTTLTRSLNGPCPLCGGRDRFYVVRSGEKCGCRKCGFHGDVVDLHAAIRRITTGEALRQLDNDYQLSANVQRPVELIPRDLEWKTPGWQCSAQFTVETARRDLLASEAAKDYLSSRGITLETAYAYSLGSGTRMDREAICIPWYAPDGRITNIKWRFLDSESPKYFSKGGGSPIIFGLNGFHDEPMGLALIEGELNAISVSACVNIDTVSIGAEGNKMLGLGFLKRLASKYQKILVWMDEPEKAIELAGDISATAWMSSSKDRSGRKLDANSLLAGSGGYCNSSVLKGLVLDALS